MRSVLRAQADTATAAIVRAYRRAPAFLTFFYATPPDRCMTIEQRPASFYFNLLFYILLPPPPSPLSRVHERRAPMSSLGDAAYCREPPGLYARHLKRSPCCSCLLLLTAAGPGWHGLLNRVRRLGQAPVWPASPSPITTTPTLPRSAVAPQELEEEDAFASCRL